MTGTIKTLRHDRGFGFIAAEDAKEYFFHHSGVISIFDDLREGDPVTFDVEPSPKGPRGTNVTRLAPAASEPAA